MTHEYSLSIVDFRELNAQSVFICTFQGLKRIPYSRIVRGMRIIDRIPEGIRY